MKRLLKGGRLVDPANGRDGMFDVLLDGARIAQVGRDLPADADTTVVEIPAGVGGLPKASFAVCHQVTTLDRAKLTKRIGALSAALRELELGLKAAMDLD